MILPLCFLLLLGSTLSAQTDSEARTFLPLIHISADENQLPVAENDAYETIENTKLVVSAAAGVLTNDSDSEQRPLQAQLVDGVSRGSLNLKRDSSFVYTPNLGFNGEDSFTYQAYYGTAISNIATVSIAVNGMNHPPQIITGEIDFTKQVIGTEVTRTHSVNAADFDADGDLDVVATLYGTYIGGNGGMLLWYENDGKGNFVENVLDPDMQGAYPSHVADVDGDGAIDVLAGGYDADTFAWYWNDHNGGFSRIDIDTMADGAHSIVTGDMDDDKDVDLVTTNQDAGSVAWYENDGSNNFARHVIDTSSIQAKRAEITDVDGDGDMDVVTASTGNYEIAWLENDGNQNFEKHIIDMLVYGPYYVSPADIDSDDDIDVFTASQWDHTIAWYQNDGASVFTKQVIDDQAEGARSVISVDIDRDGDIDALTASVDDDTVAWYENDGSGSFTWRPIDLAANGAYGVFSIDMDHDGDRDVLSASRDAGEVALHTQFKAHVASVGMGGTLLIDSTLLHTIDSDDDPVDLTYTISEDPKFGKLRVEGSAIHSGGTFTQDDIDKDRITYLHGGPNTSLDGFSFSVADGGESGIKPATGTFSINIKAPANADTA